MRHRRRVPTSAVLAAGCLAASLFACSPSPAPSAGPPAPSDGVAPTEAVREEPARPDTVISLERTECYGTCPVYRVTVSGDGSVVFKGIRFVATEGLARDTLSPAQVAELVEAVERSGVFDVEVPRGLEECPRWATDNPSAIFFVRLGERERRVSHYLGCRGFEGEDELRELARTIDRVTDVARWIGHPVEG